ncbi:aromatic-ring-hydroxylating dioxygenase subunit beta [Mycobacterium sp. ITM-2016-00317]|uniref:aromatic-ring-hydroxylating dioxygenase subunit beta n=1 Tax=Mycobacterium sp. ITM-2016-00317 TaxID=2099694 RepID=UPI000D430259|nr:aromatic-ring-hydroxylating dioxygenase subunit beta [Mycobacterium sp. ITM-2016-00317]WNG87821.1 aromatic-ring-hydroxylating dioxygenase subunit beta [Mycobacterium sp. ITM-2016-00317]
MSPTVPEVDTANQLARIEAAYTREAAQLDAHDIAGWARWLHPDFRYEVPIPVTRDGARDRDYTDRGLFAVETRHTIDLWVKRVSEDFIATAYAENLPTRTRHFVTNTRILRSADTDLLVSANVLLSWNHRGDPPTFATAERVDTLVDDGVGLMLRSRRVLLDCDVVHLHHLRVIF